MRKWNVERQENFSPHYYGPKFHLFPGDGIFGRVPRKRWNFNIIHWFCRFLNWILSLASNASDGQMTHFTTGPESSLFANHGILGVLFFRMLPVSVRKPWHFGSTVFQNAPCSETMAFWEYCFPECSLFTNHGILGVLFSRMLPVRIL